MHCSQVSWALRLGLRSARWGIKRHPAPFSAAYPKIKTVPSARIRVNLMFMVHQSSTKLKYQRGLWVNSSEPRAPSARRRTATNGARKPITSKSRRRSSLDQRTVTSCKSRWGWPDSSMARRMGSVGSWDMGWTPVRGWLVDVRRNSLFAAHAVLADLITPCFQGVIRVGPAVAMHRAVAIKDRLRRLQSRAGHVGHAAGALRGGRDTVGLSGWPKAGEGNADHTARYPHRCHAFHLTLTNFNYCV